MYEVNNQDPRPMHRSSSSTTAPPVRSRSPAITGQGQAARRSSMSISPEPGTRNPELGTRSRIPGDYAVKARTAGVVEFLVIVEGARTWLIEAAAAGKGRMNVKMAEAPTLAMITGAEAVEFGGLVDRSKRGKSGVREISGIL
jgi:hypothetical protein